MHLVETLVLGAGLVAGIAVPPMRIFIIRLGGLFDILLITTLFSTMGNSVAGGAMAASIGLFATITLFWLRGKFEYECETKWSTPVFHLKTIGLHITKYHIILFLFATFGWIPPAFAHSLHLLAIYFVIVATFALVMRPKKQEAIEELKGNPEIFYFVRLNSLTKRRLKQ